MSHFDLKSWVTGGTKIWPGIPSNWRIFELIWLKYLNKYWTKIRPRIPSNWRIFESIGLKYSSITRNPGSNFNSTSDSYFYVKMTPVFFLCTRSIKEGLKLILDNIRTPSTHWSPHLLHGRNKLCINMNLVTLFTWNQLIGIHFFIRYNS